MFRFLFSMILAAAVTPVYLKWAWEQTEGQIDKMQEAAFNTPGVEAPIPPPVLLGGLGLLLGHFLVARAVLRLRRWQAILSLLLGGATGAGAFAWQRAKDNG